MDESDTPTVGHVTATPRRRVLVSAYACGPVPEPEASAGWNVVLAAAQTSDVWVITRPRFAEPIDRALAADGLLAARVHVVYLDLSPRQVRRKNHSWDLYWFYVLWQRALTRRAQALHATHRFHVAHHVTFANDWMPCGLADLEGVPLVWGPVGGSSRMPIGRLSPWLGVRGTLTELIRVAVTTTARTAWTASVARRSAVMVAQNADVGHTFRRLAAHIEVEPNASLDALPERDPAQVRARHAVFAGRLLAWKGAALAIDAIAHPLADGWTLGVYGDGYERRRLQRLIHKRGLADRVTLHGHRPRSEVLEAISRADAFLFPSMHDQAGWVAAEASAMGCPVVCLPLGGPPALAGPNARIAQLGPDIRAEVARQLAGAPGSGATPWDRWSTARLPAVVDRWYGRATQAPGDAHPGITVLESFGEPKRTTNPYITQLYETLRTTEGLDVQTFSFRQALFGHYDVVHLHWPELMMGGHHGIGRLARRTLTALSILRWRVRGTPVVRTLHNLDRPRGIARIDHQLLDALDRLTTLDVTLNDLTPARDRIASTTIAHGHYRDWFAPVPAAEPVPGRLAYVGLIRRYKGVEDLVEAFTSWDAPEASLHIAGQPSTTELLDALVTAAGADERISFDARFLDDRDFVAAIAASELVVLPYRHMHNSGTALAALSLDRPVLVPDNDVNRALSRECGPGWVHFFEGSLGADDLARAWRDSRTAGGRPDLSKREWAQTGLLHREAFVRARSLGPRRRS